MAAIVFMPEAAMNEDYLSARDEDKIRLPGQPLDVERIAITH